MDEQSFVVSINPYKITVPKVVSQMSVHLHNMLSLGFQEEEIELQLISKETFQKFLHFCAINNYVQPTITTPIKTSNLKDVVDEKNYAFISQFPFKSKELDELIRASEFLGCKGLQRLCASVYACQIYFEDSKIAYQAKLKELGITKTVQFDDQQKFKRQYPFMIK